MIDYKLEDLILVGCKAEGYYSGSSTTECMLVRKELYSKLDEDVFQTMWFFELDGKHSEIEGEWFKGDFEATPEQVALCKHNDYEYLVDGGMCGQDSAVLSQVVEEYKEIRKDFDLEVITKVTWKGEQL
jgi:hypothetical protein